MVKYPKNLEYYTPPDKIIQIQHSKKVIERLIFPEEGPYTEKEEEKYEEFLDYLYENSEELPDSMTKRRILRFLVGNNFKLKNTFKNIVKTLAWRDEIRPIILTEDMKLLLDHGYMYLHGRDRYLRPICCSNTKMLTELDINQDEAKDLGWFVCFYIIDQILTRTKIENWIFIGDLGGLSLARIPTKTLKKFMMEAQEYQKCRMRKFYFLNVTFGLRAIYALISPFLDKVTKDKTKLMKEGYSEELLEFAHPSQVEQKFGGDAENLTTWWPPRCYSENYDVDPDNFNIPEQVTNEKEENHNVRVKQEVVSVGKSPTKPLDVKDVAFAEEVATPRPQPKKVKTVNKNCK